MNNFVEQTIKSVFSEPFRLSPGNKFSMSVEEFRKRVKRVNNDLRASGHEQIAESQVRRYFQQEGMFGANYNIDPGTLLFQFPQLTTADDDERLFRRPTRRHILDNINRSAVRIVSAETSGEYGSSLNALAWYIREAEFELERVTRLSTDTDIIDKLRQAVASYRSNRQAYDNKLGQLERSEASFKLLLDDYNQQLEEPKPGSWTIVTALIFLGTYIVYAVVRRCI